MNKRTRPWLCVLCRHVCVCVCRSVHLHSGIRVLNGDGESCSQTERFTHPDGERQAAGEWRGDTMGRVTDQDTSIIICLLAAASEFNTASSPLWWLAIAVIGYQLICVCVCVDECVWETEILRKRYFKSLLVQLTNGLARTHPGWCFCVCVSQSLFHQSASINSSNTARQLRSVMRYITSSKCILRPHQHQQLGCYLF